MPVDACRSLWSRAMVIWLLQFYPCMLMWWLWLHGNYIIRYYSVYLACTKKLTGSQPSPPHGINKKLKCETGHQRRCFLGVAVALVHCSLGNTKNSVVGYLKQYTSKMYYLRIKAVSSNAVLIYFVFFLISVHIFGSSSIFFMVIC